MATSNVSTQDLEIIKKYTLINSGTAIIPNDLLSMGAMSIIQQRMINKIADNHGLDAEGRQSVLSMASAVASGITALMDQLLTQVADSVP